MWFKGGNRFQDTLALQQDTLALQVGVGGLEGALRTIPGAHEQHTISCYLTQGARITRNYGALQILAPLPQHPSALKLILHQ